jgi:hypothetical protein
VQQPFIDILKENRFMVFIQSFADECPELLQQSRYKRRTGSVHTHQYYWRIFSWLYHGNARWINARAAMIPPQAEK